jgi:hypothetical protein
MLRIPSATDVPPPLMAPLRRAVPDEVVADGIPSVESTPERVKKRRKGKKTHKDHDHSWESIPKKSGSGRLENRQMRWMLIGGGILFVLSLGAVVFSLYTAPVVPAAPTKAATPESVPEVVKTSERSEISVLSEIEPLARGFLEAKTVEELLPTIRNPEVVESRIRSFYPQGKLNPPGLSKFNTGGVLSRKDSSVAVGVRTREQDEKQLIFVDTPQGLRADWEAWVGWSAVPWADFISAKSGTPAIFRLTLTKVDYYNFDYLDDIRWRSYRIESPDGEHALYGYVERGSAVDKMIHVDADTKSLALMLSLKFPPDSRAKDQVEIVGFITEGWVGD